MDKDQEKEIVAEKEVDLVVVNQDLVQVCCCLDVDHEGDHPGQLDLQVHHYYHLVGLHLVQVVVDAYLDLDPLVYHCSDLLEDDSLEVVNLAVVVS